MMDTGTVTLRLIGPPAMARAVTSADRLALSLPVDLVCEAIAIWQDEHPGEVPPWLSR